MARPPRRRPDEPRFENGPSEEALRFFRNKTSQPSFDWRDIWAEEHAHAFTVAKATQVEVLETIRRAVDAALAQGMTYEDFAKQLTPRLQRLGWWGQQFSVDPETGEEIIAQLGSPRRLQLIYDANIRTAHAAGQWERAQRTKFALPYLVYVETTSATPREEHLDQVGTIAHMDDPYWDTWFPPNGWNCKCGVRQVSEFEAERLGFDPDRPPPEVPMREWLNKRTGVVEEIPAGIDPGWHRNPGKIRHQTLDELLSGTLEQVDPALRAAALKDLSSSWLFRRIVAGEIDSAPGVPGFFQLPKKVDVAAPIGHFGSEITAAHGGRSGVIWLSGERVMSNPWSHVTADQWALAPRVFDEGAVIRDATRPGFLTVFRTIDGKTYRAEVALRNTMIDGTPYTGGSRLNLESFAEVNAHLAKAEITVARADGLLVRDEARQGFNLFDLKPASAGAAATPKGGGQPPRAELTPAKQLPKDSFETLSPEDNEKQLNAYLNLSKLEQAHVRTYTANEFMPINWYLRNGDVTVRQGHKLYKAPADVADKIRRQIETIAKSVQSSISSNILPEKTVLYRGQVKFSEEMLKPGFEWTDKGFTSASHRLPEALHFHDGYKAEGHPMVMLVIQGGGKRGFAVEKISELPAEREVLLPAGTKFRVLKVEPDVKRGLLDKARTYVHVEIVEQAETLSFAGRAAQRLNQVAKRSRTRDHVTSKGPRK